MKTTKNKNKNRTSTKTKSTKKMGAFLLSLLLLLLVGMTGCGKQEEAGSIRVGSLKGPTTMGMVAMMQKAQEGTLETENQYEFQMETGADVLLAKMVQGELDIALVPANVAAVLYQKTQGGVQVIDINTLGVLYLVSENEEIDTLEELKGQTIYLTGKGTTPDYVLQYLLSESGIALNEVTLEYKAEAAEVLSSLAQNPGAVGLLPQPFATVAQLQKEELVEIMDLTEQWQMLQGENGSQMVTGVTVARKEFVEAHPEWIEEFIRLHEDSVTTVNEDPAAAAELVVAFGIVEKAPVAQKAIPKCNLTCIQGTEMQQALAGYLEALFEMEPTSVGGALPAEDFYLIQR